MSSLFRVPVNIFVLVGFFAYMASVGAALPRYMLGQTETPAKARLIMETEFILNKSYEFSKKTKKSKLFKGDPFKYGHSKEATVGSRLIFIDPAMNVLTYNDSFNYTDFVPSGMSGLTKKLYFDPYKGIEMERMKNRKGGGHEYESHVHLSLLNSLDTDKVVEQSGASGNTQAAPYIDQIEDGVRGIVDIKNITPYAMTTGCDGSVGKSYEACFIPDAINKVIEQVEKDVEKCVMAGNCDAGAVASANMITFDKLFTFTKGVDKINSDNFRAWFSFFRNRFLRMKRGSKIATDILNQYNRQVHNKNIAAPVCGESGEIECAYTNPDAKTGEIGGATVFSQVSLNLPNKWPSADLQGFKHPKSEGAKLSDLLQEEVVGACSTANLEMYMFASDAAADAVAKRMAVQKSDENRNVSAVRPGFVKSKGSNFDYIDDATQNLMRPTYAFFGGEQFPEVNNGKGVVLLGAAQPKEMSTEEQRARDFGYNAGRMTASANVIAKSSGVVAKVKGVADKEAVYEITTEIYPAYWDGDVLINGESVAANMADAEDRALFFGNAAPISRKDGASDSVVEGEVTLDKDFLNYLLGDASKEGTDYKPRTSLIGDIGSSNISVANDVAYVASNDGFVHAISLTEKREIFAYSPITLLGQEFYNNRYRNYRNGGVHVPGINGKLRIARIPTTGSFGSASANVLVGSVGDGGVGGYFTINVSDINGNTKPEDIDGVALFEIINTDHPNVQVGYTAADFRNTVENTRKAAVGEMPTPLGGILIFPANDNKYMTVNLEEFTSDNFVDEEDDDTSYMTANSDDDPHSENVKFSEVEFDASISGFTEATDGLFMGLDNGSFFKVSLDSTEVIMMAKGMVGKPNVLVPSFGSGFIYVGVGSDVDDYEENFGLGEATQTEFYLINFKARDVNLADSANACEIGDGTSLCSNSRSKYVEVFMDISDPSTASANVPSGVGIIKFVPKIESASPLLGVKSVVTYADSDSESFELMITFAEQVRGTDACAGDTLKTYAVAIDQDASQSAAFDSAEINNAVGGVFGDAKGMYYLNNVSGEIVEIPRKGTTKKSESESDSSKDTEIL